MTDAPAMATLLLDRSAWDLCVDASGNIAMAQPPYAQAQDMASAIRTFQGEVYYDQSLGTLNFSQDLGHLPPTSFIRAQLIAAAETVPGVTAAQAYLSSLDTSRELSGQVQASAGGATVVATTPPVGGRPFIIGKSYADGPDVIL